MTKGHHHAKRSRSEFYLAISGAGVLILMDEKRQMRFEAMATGSLHYVPSHTAHRIANAGDCVLTVLACWPSDAGHDYESIAPRLQRKPASGGRRSCARGRAMKALAVDLGGSHATCALVEDNCVVASRTVSADRMSQITASHFGEDTEVPVHGTVQRRSGRRGVQLCGPVDRKRRAHGRAPHESLAAPHSLSHGIENSFGFPLIGVDLFCASRITLQKGPPHERQHFRSTFC